MQATRVFPPRVASSQPPGAGGHPLPEVPTDLLGHSSLLPRIVSGDTAPGVAGCRRRLGGQQVGYCPLVRAPAARSQPRQLGCGGQKPGRVQCDSQVTGGAPGAGGFRESFPERLEREGSLHECVNRLVTIMHTRGVWDSKVQNAAFIVVLVLAQSHLDTRVHVRPRACASVLRTTISQILK